MPCRAGSRRASRSTQSGEHSLARLRVLWDGTLRGKLIPLAQLSSSFPGRHGEVSLAYAQSADLIGQLLQSDRGPSALPHADRGAAARRSVRLRRSRAASACRCPTARAPLARGAEPALRSLAVDPQRARRWCGSLAAVLLVIGYLRVRRQAKQTLEALGDRRGAAAHASRGCARAAAARPSRAPRSVADDVLDAWTDQQRRESGVPTIVHEGRSLHSPLYRVCGRCKLASNEPDRCTFPAYRLSWPS